LVDACRNQANSHSLPETFQMSYENIIVETHGAVGLITLNRPDALNALSSPLQADLTAALDDFEADDAIGAIVLTGSKKAFAAGADIKEMQSKTYASVQAEDFITAGWERVSRCRKPVIAAVAGFALGGGCEMAMMCDFILAADNAKFGQPEIKLGIIAGAGGTQRLTRFVGKSKSMEMHLTGRMMDAEEAERSGLVSRIIPVDQLLDEALKVAAEIAAMSRPSVMMAKESVNRAYETTLREGVLFERRVFHSLFAFEDQTEGMQAFVEKRKPDFKNQ
jgi:enoyl-CoA hydratase